MTPALWLENIGAFALQLAAVIGAGLLLALVVPVGRPRAALVYWRVVLLGCLLMPLAQPWTPTTPTSVPAIAATEATVRDTPHQATSSVAAGSAIRWSVPELALWVELRR